MGFSAIDYIVLLAYLVGITIFGVLFRKSQRTVKDYFVGAMKGAILSVSADAEIIDVTHEIKPQDVRAAAFTLANYYQTFPPQTIHVCVVDPGVGSNRRAILVETETYYFVAPDNGVLSLMYAREERLNVRHISSDHYFLQPLSNTFHGRDVFAPVAAYLAKGVDQEKFGNEITDFVRFNAPKPKATDAKTLRGVVLKVDRFGNLITNITPQDVPALFQSQPASFKILVGKKEITTLRTNYAEGAPGEIFAIVGSMGYLEIAANRGAAAQLSGAGKGAEVSIVLEGAIAAGNGT